MRYLACGRSLFALQASLRLGLEVGSAKTRTELALQTRCEGGAAVTGLVRNDWRRTQSNVSECVGIMR